MRIKAGTLLAALLASGCSLGGDDTLDSPVELAERIGCSGSFEAMTTEALGVEAIGRCTFEGHQLSLVTFAGNGERNSYVCSTCGFTPDTPLEEIERAGQRSGGYLVAGDGYLVQATSATTEQAVREALS